jgi:hypothetical protein
VENADCTKGRSRGNFLLELWTELWKRNKTSHVQIEAVKEIWDRD